MAFWDRPTPALADRRPRSGTCDPTWPRPAPPSLCGLDGGRSGHPPDTASTGTPVAAWPSEIATSKGSRPAMAPRMVSPVAIEPVCDIAALGADLRRVLRGDRTGPVIDRRLQGRDTHSGPHPDAYRHVGDRPALSLRHRQKKAPAPRAAGAGGPTEGDGVRGSATGSASIRSTALRRGVADFCPLWKVGRFGPWNSRFWPSHAR
jgi:hypothetical protein